MDFVQVSIVVQKGETEEQNGKDTHSDEAKRNQAQKKKKNKKPSKQKGTSFIWHWEIFWHIKYRSHYCFLFCLPADSSPTSDSQICATSNVEQLETKLYHEYSAAQDYEGIDKYANTKTYLFRIF